MARTYKKYSNKNKHYGCQPWVNHTIGYPQSETNRTNVVPVDPLTQYELDLLNDPVKYPPGTTYDEWRAMQNMIEEVTEFGQDI